MGASRSAAGRLLGFLADAQARGTAEALKSLNMGDLIGKSANDIFFGLADYVCPTEGTVDSGVARDAYAETIIDLVKAGFESLEAITESQVAIVFESFLANSIFERLCSDVGTGLVQLPSDIRQAASIQSQIKEFIAGRVRDVLGSQLDLTRVVSQVDANKVATNVYRQAFSVLASFNEK